MEDQHSQGQGDFVHLLAVLQRRWRWAVLCPLAAAVLGFAWASMLPKQYEATAVLIAGQGQGLADPSAVIEIEQATQSLATMATDRVVVEAAAERLSIDADIDELAKKVRSDVPPSTQRIELTVTDTDPTLARRLANGVAEEFSELVKEQAAPGSQLTVAVWQPAVTPKDPSGPKVVLYVLITLVLGVLGGVGMALLREHLDERWRSEDDAESYLGIPVLASIPPIASPRVVHAGVSAATRGLG